MTLQFNPIVPNVAPSESFLEVFSPYDQQLVGKVSTSGEAHVEQAIKTASQLFSNKSQWLSKSARRKVLQNIAQRMQAQFEELAVLATSEGGKPIEDSRVEVTRAIEGIYLCIEAMQTQGGSAIPMQLNAASEHKFAFTKLEPIGVVVSVSAFNHPLNLIVHQVAPAIAAGCPVIVKPAETTPLSCFKFVSMVLESGLPEGWCQCLMPSSHSVAEKLVTDQNVGFFSFIGSAKVGWMLRSKLSPGARCALEHGGAAPLIAVKDANIDQLLPKVLKGGFYHAGQVCVSVQRVYIDKTISKGFLKDLVEQAAMLSVGDPLDPNTEVGPLISVKEVDRVHQWVTEAVEQGAELLFGGEKKSDTVYQPTILLNPPRNCQVSQKEIFGPVICIYEYSNLDEAIEQANSLPFVFQASVFTQSIDTAMKVYSAINASAVMLNEHTAFRVDWMPFAGLRQSGLGVGGIEHTFKDMQIEKMMVIHSDEIQ